MPIYQNCTSGHWKQGSARFQWLGTLLHYAAMAWGGGFFVWQILCSDCVRFYFFLTGGQVQTLTQLWEIQTPGVEAFNPFSYHGALVIMLCMYLALMISGFAPSYIKLQSAVMPHAKSFRNDRGTDELRQRCSSHEYEQLAVTASSFSNSKNVSRRNLRTTGGGNPTIKVQQSSDAAFVSGGSTFSDDDDEESLIPRSRPKRDPSGRASSNCAESGFTL